MNVYWYQNRSRAFSVQTDSKIAPRHINHLLEISRGRKFFIDKFMILLKCRVVRYVTDTPYVFRMFSYGEFKQEDQEKMLEQLNKKVEEVYRSCIGDNEANIRLVGKSVYLLHCPCKHS